MDAVLRDFGNRTRGEDPVIHFYEEFLKAYDKKLKVQRGVFYTPQPVVSYIVRSVHELLQTEFGLIDGLADTTTWGEMLKTVPRPQTAAADRRAGREAHDLSGRTLRPDPRPRHRYGDLPRRSHRGHLPHADGEVEAAAPERTLSSAAAWNDYVPKHLLPRLHAFELMMAPYAIAHMKIGLKLAETGYRFGSPRNARASTSPTPSNRG